MPRPTVLPAYRDLPRVGALSQPSGWGVFGADDTLGRLNLATPEGFRSAASELVSGRAIPLNWSVDLPSPAILGRRSPVHVATRVSDGWDDYLDAFYPQASSQWDALCHCRHPELGYYNGVESPDELNGGATVRGVLGMHNFARHGIAARFVLADVESFARRTGRAWSCDSPIPIDVSLLEAVLDAQNAEIREGDILLLRTGWTAWYSSLDEDARRRLPDEAISAPGLAREEPVLEWLWDHGVAGVASDTPCLEQMPIDTTRADGFLHYQLIPLLGFLLGELFDLDTLGAACADANRWEGALTAAPLNLTSAVGSPANALAFL